MSKRNRQIEEHADERARTNTRQNRAFIDHVLGSRDEQAIKNLFEEYFHLHAEQHEQNRITWTELQFIIQEIFQGTHAEFTLSEATHLFYQIYQAQHANTIDGRASPSAMNQSHRKRGGHLE